MVEDQDSEKECEHPTYGLDDVVPVNEDERERALFYIVQKILVIPKQGNSQQHSLFKTRCTVHGKICDVIIDSGNIENIVSKALVQALGLVTTKHPHQYKIGWIKRGNEGYKICV